MFQTEYEFQLPRGYIDKEGNLHKKGVMRLATAADEIFPLKDPRTVQNSAYITVIILTRVIVKLGNLPQINTSIIENLFAADMNYLQDLYNRINNSEVPGYSIDCPHCGSTINLAADFFSQGR